MVEDQAQGLDDVSDLGAQLRGKIVGNQAELVGLRVVRAVALWVVGVDGSRLTEVVSGVEEGLEPAWSPVD